MDHGHENEVQKLREAQIFCTERGSSVQENSMSVPKRTMSVPEMRRLLGVKKTESYWLVHRNFFKTELVGGRMRVDVESFEKWYANQVKHKKVNGEAPGKELVGNSYSFREAANLLGVNSSNLYEIWKKNGLKTILVDFVMRIPMEEFEQWYGQQSVYRKAEKTPTLEEMESEYIELQEAAALLEIPKAELNRMIAAGAYKYIFEVRTFDDRKWISRKSFQQFLNTQSVYRVAKRTAASGKGLETRNYLSRQEAAELAGVAPSTVTKWLQAGKFSGIGAGKVLRIHREEFLQWVGSCQCREGGV